MKGDRVRATLPSYQDSELCFKLPNHDLHMLWRDLRAEIVTLTSLRTWKLVLLELDVVLVQPVINPNQLLGRLLRETQSGVPGQPGIHRSISNKTNTSNQKQRKQLSLANKSQGSEMRNEAPPNASCGPLLLN